MFLYLYPTDFCNDFEQLIKDTAFGVFMGFNSYGFELQRVGTYFVKDIETLCEQYENIPDFIFTNFDWDNLSKKINYKFIS